MTSSSPDMALVKVPEKTIQDRSSIPNPVVVLQAASRARQDQGVQLYEVQEQVAGLQASLSRLQASAAQAAQERSREEVALQQAEAELASAKRAHAERDGGTAALRAALAATEVARRSAAGDAQRAQHEAGATLELAAARRELAGLRRACVEARREIGVHAARAARASARQEGPVHREAAELEGRLGAQARGLQRQDDRHSILQAQLLAGRRAEAACRRALHALEAQKATALEGLRAGPGGRIDGLRDTLAELAQWLRAAREEGRLAGRRATTKQRKSLLASRLAQLEGRLEEARACAARHGADLERLLAAAGASDARLAAVGASVSAALGLLLADQREREEALRAVRDERTALRAQVAREARRGERLALELERTIARRAVVCDKARPGG
ncbi:hypothetical protein F751_5210 [Auxenochlorella protothecoides]|uniref:Uncharacterized protein n=1 Tax=Auxenochlorella protothecoides TaxID=3075 RepID=A0A087SQU5_AUXPR|nr:hypothetical protein F751_5210 [Auxenochlorella protothecoides]KFM28099.1 hypothetical protein F751_5210 [Auxenochlorella protothecoides]